MKVIISPAKKMNIKTDILPYKSVPVFLEETEKLMQWVQALSLSEAQKLWGELSSDREYVFLKRQ